MTPENWAREWHTEQIFLAIARALIRLMAAPELFNNFDRTLAQHYRVRIEITERLVAFCHEDPSNCDYARQLALELLKHEPQIAATKRSALDGTLARLLPALPQEEQIAFAVEFLTHRRLTRRRVGLGIIAKQFRPEHKPLLIDCYKRFGDDWALTTLTRVDVDITDVVELFLNVIADVHEQARFLGKLMVQDFIYASRLADRFPVAFVWGAGRARRPEALPIVLDILRDKRRDFANLGLVVWALGQLGARGQLEELADDFGVQFPRRDA